MHLVAATQLADSIFALISCCTGLPNIPYVLTGCIYCTQIDCVYSTIPVTIKSIIPVSPWILTATLDQVLSLSLSLTHTHTNSLSLPPILTHLHRLFHMFWGLTIERERVCKREGWSEREHVHVWERQKEWSKRSGERRNLGIYIKEIRDNMVPFYSSIILC